MARKLDDVTHNFFTVRGKDQIVAFFFFPFVCLFLFFYFYFYFFTFCICLYFTKIRVCSFWPWIKLFIDDEPLPLINFFDWLGSRWGWVRFFVAHLFFCFCLGRLLYTSCILWVVLWVPFSFIYILLWFYLSEKNKKFLLYLGSVDY